MIVNIHHTCTDFDSYRAERVKSLFNVETGADVKITADLPIESEHWQDKDWQIGVIVGRSGTGKTSIGKQIWADTTIYNPTWQTDKPIIDQIAIGDSIDKATVVVDDDDTLTSLWQDKLAPIGLELFKGYLNGLVADW